MKESEAFYRYAKALFRIDASQELDQALSGCARLMQEVPHFTPYFESPQISRLTKVKTLQSFIQNPLIVRFLTVLIQRKHFKQLPRMAQAYHQMCLEKFGLMEGRLVTAFPIDQVIVDQFKKRLEHVFQRGFTVKTTIDPTLIGGTLLFVGDRLVDYSFKGRLTVLKNDLLRGPHVA